MTLHDGRVSGTFTLAVRAGRIFHNHRVVDADKLADINVILDP